MMKPRLLEWKAPRAMRACLAAVCIVCMSALLGCATQSAPSNASGSRVEVYGEIDAGYSYSRTKTTVQGK